MEFFEIMSSYFGLNNLAEAQTFPELLQTFLCTMFAMYIVVSIFRAVFTATWKIRQDLTGRR